MTTADIDDEAPESSLNADKEPKVIVHRSLRSSLGLVLLFVIALYYVYQAVRMTGSGARWLGIIPLVPLLELVRRYFNDVYVIGRDRIVHYKGRISLTFMVPSIRCVDLRAISVDQGLLGRILGYGSVSLSTAAQSGAEVVMYGVRHPYELSRRIDELRVDSQRAILKDAQEQGQDNPRLQDD